MRVPFLEVDHFAHLKQGNGESVKQEFDVTLKRYVVVIRSQRTPLHMVHVFTNVIPGMYLIQFRLRLPESRLAFLYRNGEGHTIPPVRINVRPVPRSSTCSCDDPDRTDITPVNGGGRNFPFPLLMMDGPTQQPSFQVIEQLINARHWIRIWEHTHVTHSDTVPPTLSNATLNYDAATDWFFLSLKPFSVDRMCHIQVEFKAEAEEFRWKKGMYWDFLELRHLPNSS